MVIRPTNRTGDMLPVLSLSTLLKGAEAVARLAEARLKLLAGEWWENPAWGNEVVEMLQGSRFTEADAQALSSCLTSYIRETPGVQEIRDVSCSAGNRRLCYACTIETDSGSAAIQYTLPA